MSKFNANVSVVRLTKDVEFQKLPGESNTVKALLSVVADRSGNGSQKEDYLEGHLFLNQEKNAKGIAFLEKALKKGKRVSFSGELRVDRYNDNDNIRRIKPYVFIERYNDLDIIDFPEKAE